MSSIPVLQQVLAKPVINFNIYNKRIIILELYHFKIIQPLVEKDELELKGGFLRQAKAPLELSR